MVDRKREGRRPFDAIEDQWDIRSAGDKIRNRYANGPISDKRQARTDATLLRIFEEIEHAFLTEEGLRTSTLIQPIKDFKDNNWKAIGEFWINRGTRALTNIANDLEWDMGVADDQHAAKEMERYARIHINLGNSCLPGSKE